MDLLFKASSPFKKLYLLATFLMLATLTACGGGGFEEEPDTSNPNNPTPNTITISLSLVSAATGQTTQTITSANPGRVVATVTGITSPVIVTFSTDVAVIPIPTAITNSSNSATVDIQAGSSLGAGTVTASIVSGETATLVYAVGATNLRMGSGSPFQEGVATVGAAQISAGGTTTVTVNVVDSNNQPFSEPVEVNFSSACTNSVPATATLSSPITTVNGTASSTYLAQGCVGNDAINVTANAGGISMNASALVNVLSANVGSIEFVSATPERIVIKGAGGIGGSESSTVLFRVKDTNGNPVNGQLVNFQLNTGIGQTTIDPSSATTNSNGLVQTVVNSGTISASVRITATIDASDPTIATQSSNLVISTGIPDQDSFTLSASNFNPEAWNISGTEVDITAFLADGFNNPVPDGTAVSFSTEGGNIQPSCTTLNGRCTVVWNSQNPVPTGAIHEVGGLGPSTNNLIFNSDGTDNVFSLGQPYGGRATITATAIGEESFPDSNGNGRFDASEMNSFLTQNDIGGRAYDLDEAYYDYNEDGFFNPGEDNANEQAGGDLEEPIDFDSDFSWTQRDGKYNGVLCSIPAHDGCSTQKSIHVRSQLVLVMSGSNPVARVIQTNDSPADDPNDNTLRLALGSIGSVSVIISDYHNQPMPAGSTVLFETTIGTMQGTSTYDIPSTNNNGGLGYTFAIKAPTTTGIGNANLVLTTPSGLKTVIGLVTVEVF